MNFGDIRTIVRDYINDVAADVDQHITDAVNFLSIVFPSKAIYDTQETFVDVDYIDKPADCMRVRRITIDDVEIFELTSFENLEPAEDEDVMQWYEYDGKIQLTIPMTSTGDAIKIWYDVSFVVDSGGNWEETQPAGDVAAHWDTVASDSDGSNLIAAVDGGRLYTSSDSGVSWTERQPGGAVNLNWRSVASDADGSNLIAAIDNGRLYTSSDSGVSWTERQPGGAVNLNWQSVASDADGSNLIAAIDNGRLYTSSDSGVSWTERQPAGAANKTWHAVASDSDGSNLVAAIEGGRLYTSDDAGVSWTERQPGGNVDLAWHAVASDDDGSNLIVAVGPGRLYISDDAGVSWTESGVWEVDLEWRSVASDDDGSNLIAGHYTNRLFIFSDDLEVNVAELLTELVYVGAAYRYYRKMVSIKVTAPATYPEIELDELRKVLDQWKGDYYKLLDQIIKYKK